MCKVGRCEWKITMSCHFLCSVQIWRAARPSVAPNAYTCLILQTQHFTQRVWLHPFHYNLPTADTWTAFLRMQGTKAHPVDPRLGGLGVLIPCPATWLLINYITHWYFRLPIQKEYTQKKCLPTQTEFCEHIFRSFCLKGRKLRILGESVVKGKAFTSDKLIV